MQLRPSCAGTAENFAEQERRAAEKAGDAERVRTAAEKAEQEKGLSNSTPAHHNGRRAAESANDWLDARFCPNDMSGQFV